MLLHHQFVQTALKNRKKVAIFDQTAKKDYTYSQILMASLMLSKEISKVDDSNIGVLVPTSAGAVVSMMAILIANKTPVFINYATGVDANIEYARRKCGFTTVLTSQKFLKKKEMIADNSMILLEEIMGNISIKDKVSAVLKSYFPSKYIGTGNMNDNAVILLTSGSEKEPKAVQLSHKNLDANLKSIRPALGFTSEEKFVASLPLFHVYGLTTTCWTPLILGCSVITHANPLDYSEIVKSIKKYEAEVLVATPTFLHGYLQKAKKGDLSSLRIVVAGADKMQLDLRNRYLDEHGIDVLEGYGATETSPVVSVNRIGNNKPGSIGLPLDDVFVEIRDVETGSILERGREGKIMVKGDLVMKGYLDDESRTHEVINDGWYDTGDIGVLDNDNFLWHKGRYKRFIKIAGEMVSLVAIESKLQEYLPLDSHCCVIEVPHPSKGLEILAALTTEVNYSEIISKMSKHFPRIILPKKFMYFSELPLMGSGKVNFREVKKQCLDKLQLD